MDCEMYTAKGICEFYENYDPKKSRAWICEHREKIIGSLFLMDRSDAAQLRYFLIDRNSGASGWARN